MGLILPTDAAMGIADRVKFGDPVAGWRGDPEADVYISDDGSEAAVYMFDRQGLRYLACVVSTYDPGWRHDLLRRLRDGDWRRDDLVERRIREVDDANAARDKKMYDSNEEKAEKMAWALRRDVGAHVGGLTKEFY